MAGVAEVTHLTHKGHSLAGSVDCTLSCVALPSDGCMDVATAGSTSCFELSVTCVIPLTFSPPFQPLTQPVTFSPLARCCRSPSQLMEVGAVRAVCDMCDASNLLSNHPTSHPSSNPLTPGMLLQIPITTDGSRGCGRGCCHAHG